jgi:hypothetical protein
MHMALTDKLSAWEALRGNPVLLYCCGGRQSVVPKMIDEEDVLPLYECLRRIGRTKRLDVVLYTSGGYANVARRIALLLHEYTEQLNIVVPYKARSAGTLLCLGAHQLVLGPLAELGPLDPHIAASGDGPAGSPPSISAEDIRAFRDIAEIWFGLESEAHRMQVFGLLSQRIFPTTLSSFFRSDRQVRLFGEELLRYQLGDDDEKVRRRVVDQLVSGYQSHDHCITRAEARRLGLHVIATSCEEEANLWELWQSYLAEIRPQTASEQSQISGMIATTAMRMRYVTRLPAFNPAIMQSVKEAPGMPALMPSCGWEPA